MASLFRPRYLRKGSDAFKVVLLDNFNLDGALGWAESIQAAIIEAADPKQGLDLALMQYSFDYAAQAFLLNTSIDVVMMGPGLCSPTTYNTGTWFVRSTRNNCRDTRPIVGYGPEAGKVILHFQPFDVVRGWIMDLGDPCAIWKVLQHAKKRYTYVAPVTAA
jgi:hypothetical protein